MKPRIRGIDIPRLCTEDWESMDRAEGQERYCSQCAHCVTDFTVLRDREIIERVLASEGRICGRLTRDQLDRVNLALRPEPQPSIWRSALLALAGIACTLPPATAAPIQSPTMVAAGQAAEPEEGSAAQEPSPAEPGTVTLPVFEGRVVSGPDGEPLSGATVTILETDATMETDADGRFWIDFGQFDPPPQKPGIVITHEGYEPRELTLETTEARVEVTILLQPVGSAQREFFLGRIQANYHGRP